MKIKISTVYQVIDELQQKINKSAHQVILSSFKITDKPSLRKVIIIPFVLQIVGIVGLVGYLSYRNGQETIKDLAYQLMDEVDNRVEENLQHYLDVPEQINKNMAAAIRAGVFNWEDFSSLEGYFAQKLQIYDTVSTFAIATEAKEFLAVEKSLASDSLIIRVMDKSTNYAFHYYTANSQGKRLKLTKVRHDYNPHQDPPHSRPWYQATREASHGIWLPVVNLSQGVNRPILTVVNFLPFKDSDGNFQGVLASSLFLNHFTKFLQDLEVGNKGQVFIIDLQGLMIASSTGETGFKANLDADYLKNLNPQEWRLMAKNSSNFLTRLSVKSLLNRVKNIDKIDKTQAIEFKFEQDRYYLNVKPIRNKSDIKWLIITVVPESNFVANINAHNRITFTICIAALFGSTVVGILTANWIAKPILNLNTAAKAIARGECHKKVEITRSDEIGELAKSFNLMAEKLQEHLTKLQSLNQDLSQSESKLKQFIEAIPVGISIHDPTGKVVYFNEMAKDLLGIEDIPDTTTESLAEVYQLYRENQLYPVEELPALRALRGEKVFIDDIQLHRHNLIIPFEVHGTPIFDKEGKISYAIIAFTDITKRKKYEKLLADYNRTLAERIAQKTADLEESKQQLSRLIDNLPGYVYRVTNDRNYTPQFISEGAFLVTGYRQEEYLIDRTISCAQEIHPADREIVWEIIQKAVAARDYYECEYRIITKSGSEKWLWERGCGIYNETGEVLLLEGFVTDITDRKIAEAKLLETQRIAHIGSWEYDVATQTTTCSKEIYQIHGIDPNQKPPTLDELIQRFHPEDRERYIKLIYEKAIAGQAFEADLRIIRNDGSIRHIEARGESAFNDKGELIRLFGTVLDISDRKEIEEKLRYSETRLNTIVTNTSDGILIVDTEGKISFANPAAMQLFNLPLDKLIDYHWGIPLQNTSEIEIIDFNGRKIRTAEIKLTQIQWMGDSAYLVTLRDITESKQRDKEIRQLSTALENAVEGISQLDKEGRYITVNKAYADITGYKPEEMIGMEWPITVHPEDRAKMIAAYQEMLAVGKVEAQARGIRKDGSIFYKQLVMVTAYDEEENFIGHYCFMKDITHAYQEAIQRQQAEEALRQSEQRFREIAENISQLFFVKSAISGQFIYISPAYQKIWGRTCESLYQNPQLWIEALHPEDREFVEASLKQQFTGNSVQREYRIIRPDGEVRWVFADISAIRDETGKPLRFIGIAEDISDRKQAQVELAQAKEAAETANLAKSTFLANMSHELRTPLNGILGYAQIFQKAPNFTLKQKEGVEVIYNCGNHLLTLINDILDLSKIEAGKLELYPEELHFTSFLLNIIQIFILRSKQKEINFNYLTEIPTNTVVYADEKRLRQVLINLLSNAVKFTNTGSVTFKIEVISQAQSVITSAPIANQPILNNQPPITTQTIRFQVEDTGIGMTESQIEKIFLPFEQVGNTSHRSEGSGLGLAITKKILEMMSSQVFVKSTPEIGSIFWFDLDLPILSPSENLTSFKSTHTIIGYSGTKRKILVVDDRWENSAVIRNILESIGFELAEAENGEAGLAKAIEFQPDLIFADLIMPVMDGYEMTRQLRQLPEFQNTIIIAISANAFAVDREKSLASGCQDFIPKPIQAEQLLQKIQDYLKLEWIYQEIEAEEENNMSISEMLIPPMEELATLYEACQLGDTDTVEAEAIRIQKLDPKYNAFTQKILALVADFDCEKITSLVDSLQ